jgi:hypothetical protein
VSRTLELLHRLEAIAEQHSERYDDQVCAALGEAVFYGFMKHNPDYRLPEAFGMRTVEGDALVREALARFLQAAHQATQQFGLDTFQKRTEAFQNPNVLTTSGRKYEDFFDCLSAEWWENEKRNQRTE